MAEMKAQYWYRNNKKNRYSGHTSEDKILKSGYTILQTKKGLSKAWIGYTIAKNKSEHERMKYYALVIQKLKRTSRCWQANNIWQNFRIWTLMKNSGRLIQTKISEGSEGCRECPQVL